MAGVISLVGPPSGTPTLVLSLGSAPMDTQVAAAIAAEAARAVAAELALSTSRGALAASNQWLRAQISVPAALVDAATITIDMTRSNNFAVTLGGNRTLGLPTGLVAGQAGQVVVKQDATGNRTLAYNAVWKFRTGAAPTLSTAAGALDILSYYVVDAATIAVSAGIGFA